MSTGRGEEDEICADIVADRRGTGNECKDVDMVNHPPHYTFGKIEVIDVIDDWQLDFNAGNALKYIARHRHKGRPLEDLKKARWYLDRAISNLEKQE